MNLSRIRREGPFVAEMTGNLLSARRETPETGWGSSGEEFRTAAASESLFILPVAEMPGFVMHGDGLYVQNAHDALAPLYCGGDAAQLLRCITGLLTDVETRRSARRKFTEFSWTMAPFLLAGGLLVIACAVASLITSPTPHLCAVPDAGAVYHPKLAPASSRTSPLTASRGAGDPAPQELTQPAGQPAPALPLAGTPADGWDLPLSVRAELPGKLRSAASRGLFTVPLSSGHTRTIYVFSDPSCPNCQRMERHFETASGTVNVVVFPVTIEGREASLKTLTPVMALPEAQRAAAWKQLFAADAGMGAPGAVQAAPAITYETQAETARGAIGVNEVAFRAYRLPGTPWTISDDGRYVPQSVLSSPVTLEAFLNGGGHDGQ
ncbi:thioredoxin fold domain-containing protein [Erwinia amylovora]|uniref:thioredoxin fold domain-containing protein n=1 Tax=Erwinia amylovora TaxID=552 RepID=UPI0014441978|nr:thioredoxin fold domain-containing protein [Erwinia amylovora]